MKIFTSTANPDLGKEVAKKLGLPLSPLDIFVFPDGEKRVRVLQDVVDEICCVIAPTSPPVDQNYMELFFIIDCLKRSGAKEVIAVVPYLGYQRQDHIFRDGEAVSLDVVIETMESTGVDRFILCDLHSIKIPELFHQPAAQISALPIFAEKIKQLMARFAARRAHGVWPASQERQRGEQMGDCVLVTPDMGGIRRIKILSELLDNMPYATIEKDRDLATGKVTSDKINGEVAGKTAFIVDDMISSGGTIRAACELLEKNNASEMYVFATHPVFSENAADILEKCGAKKVFVTDTIAIPESKQFAKLEVLSIAGILAETLSASRV